MPDQVRNVRSSLPEEEEAAETTCDGLVTHSLSLCAMVEEEGQKMQNDIEIRKKGVVQGRCFKIVFLFPITMV